MFDFEYNNLINPPDDPRRYEDCPATYEAVSELDDQMCLICGRPPRDHNSENFKDKGLPI